MCAKARGAVKQSRRAAIGARGGHPREPTHRFGLSKQTFVGTATAIGLFVDAARMPVYLAMQHDEIMGIWPWVALATVGVILGTVLGSRVLVRIPDVWFHRVLAVVLALLGGTMMVRAV